MVNPGLTWQFFCISEGHFARAQVPEQDLHSRVASQEVGLWNELLVIPPVFGETSTKAQEYTGVQKALLNMLASFVSHFGLTLCTKVVAYVDKKLEYTEGNFDIFAQKKGLSRARVSEFADEAMGRDQQVTSSLHSAMSAMYQPCVQEQIDAMLSGNLSFDTKNGEEEDGEGQLFRCGRK